jgi:hypothetical protein
MPVVMLSNACTPLGQVNGATGTAVGIVIDPTGKHTFLHKIYNYDITNPLPLADFFEIDDLYVMCTKPSACVLFKPDDPRIPEFGFQGLDGSIMPVFPLKKSISWKGYSIRRQQVLSTRCRIGMLVIPSSASTVRHWSSTRP